MSLQKDSTDPGQSASPLNWLDEEMRSGLINRDRQRFVTLHRYKKCYGDVAVQEAEIREKIKIEIAFQGKLVSAFDREGYFVEDVGAPDEREKASIGGGLENGPDRTLSSWQCFRVLSKDVTIPYWLTVWFFGDKAKLPPGLRSSIKEWRTLCGDDICESGSSKIKALEGMSFTDATMPHCCHLLVKEERLLFETLPLPVMRATLLDGHLADELASKVRMAFERIRAKIQVETILSKKTITCPVCDGKGKVALTFLPDDIKRISMDHFDMTLPRSLRESNQVAMFLYRKLLGMTLPQIVETCGKTQTAVIHACKTVQDRMQCEPEFRDTVIRIVHDLVSCHIRRSWKTAQELLL